MAEDQAVFPAVQGGEGKEQPDVGVENALLVPLESGEAEAPPLVASEGEVEVGGVSDEGRGQKGLDNALGTEVESSGGGEEGEEVQHDPEGAQNIKETTVQGGIEPPQASEEGEDVRSDIIDVVAKQEDVEAGEDQAEKAVPMPDGEALESGQEAAGERGGDDQAADGVDDDGINDKSGRVKEKEEIATKEESGSSAPRKGALHEQDAGEANEVDLPEVYALEVSSDTKMDREMRMIIADLARDKDWLVRAAALRKFQSLITGGAVSSLAFQKALKGTDVQDRVQHLFSDLRSQMVHEASDAFLLLAESVGAASDRTVKDYEIFLSDTLLPEVLKTVVKANVVIAGSGDVCVRGLLMHVHTPRLLRPILEQLMNSQANTKLRMHCSEYLLQVLQSWPSEKIEKASYMQDGGQKRIQLTDAIEHGIKSCLSDGRGETRTNGKAAYELYQGLFPARGDALHGQFNKQQLRILKEQPKDREKDTVEKRERKGKAKIALQPKDEEGGEDDAGCRKPGKNVSDEYTAMRSRISELMDKLQNTEHRLEVERRKNKSIASLRDDAERKLSEEKKSRALAEKSTDNTDLVKRLDDVVKKLSKEQSKSRKYKEESIRLQEKCKAQEADFARKSLEAAPAPLQHTSGEDERPLKCVASEGTVKHTQKSGGDGSGRGSIEADSSVTKAGISDDVKRANIEIEFKQKELAHVKDRWALREGEWFKARMELEATIESMRSAALDKDKIIQRLRGELAGVIVEGEEDYFGENNTLDDPHSSSRADSEVSQRRNQNNDRRARNRDDGAQKSSSWSEGGGSTEGELVEKLRQQLDRQEALAKRSRATAEAAQQEMAHWRSRVGEVEKERAEYKERLDKARGELDWRQRIHQQEQIRMRAIIEQTDAGRARAEANVKEMVSVLRQGNGSVYSQAGVYSGDAESYTKASGHQNDHVDGDLNMPHQSYQKYQGNGMMPNGQVPVSDEWPRYGPYGNYAGNPANVVRNRPQYRNSFDDGMLDFRAMDPDKRRLPPVHPDPNKPMQRNSVGEQPHPPPGKKGMRGGRAEKIESKRAI